MARGTPDVDDIQGNILRGFSSAENAYLFCRVAEAALAKTWLAELAPTITTASHKPDDGTLNIAITSAGLAALGVSQASLDTFPKAFQQGMANRGRFLRDTGDNAPHTWEHPFWPPAVLHLLITIARRHRDTIDQPLARMRSSLLGAGLEPLGEPLITRRLPGDKEHFGYKDGVSQPGVLGVHDEGAAGEGVLQDGNWWPLQPGEFILGMRDEDGAPAALPTPAELGRNGSYLVLRKLKQDVPQFRRLIADRASRLGLPEYLVKAKLMGRWPDGTPLTGRPGGPDPSVANDPSANNRFTYDEDLAGRQCPVGSHIRRANPRGSLGFDGALERRHRIIRRGMPYGDQLPEGVEDDADRGLLFACYQADIERQFEFIQAHWLNDGNVFGLGADRDPIVGDPGGGTGRMCIEGAPPKYVEALQRTVIVRGGAYLLVPGIAALDYLSRLPDPQPSGSTTR